MAEPRPIWRGHLRLALVSCPVALYPAHHEHGNLHFHFINPGTGHRVRTLTVDAETGEELARGELARGYEFRKDHYLVLGEEDFEAARIDSSALLKIDKFVPADAIDPVYYDTAYYMAPDGEAGDDVFAVIRDAIVRSKRVALSRVVIARRERAVAIRPTGRGLIAHTLYEARDIHDPGALFEGIPAAKPDPAMIDLAVQLIDRETGAFDAADMEDRYEARLRAVIEAKLKGEHLEPEPEPEDTGNVVDLMAALKRSLGENANPARAAGAKAKASSAKKTAPARKPARRRA